MVSGEFTMQCRVMNKPYDVFGTWYNDCYLLSGNLYWTGHLNSCSAISLNKVIWCLVWTSLIYIDCKQALILSHIQQICCKRLWNYQGQIIQNLYKKKVWLLNRVESIVAKREIAHHEHFCLLPQWLRIASICGKRLS